MPFRLYNYSAFYVSEPFNPSNLGANATPDFIYYNTLRAWKGRDTSFPFYDAHATTYNVRDNSSWETLKERLHDRLRHSKNIILFLSSNTKASKALVEELDYGINVLGLPVIVVYPDYCLNSTISNGNTPNALAKALWDKLKVFRDNYHKVPTAHVPLDKSFIQRALNDKDFTVQNKSTNYCWCYS